MGPPSEKKKPANPATPIQIPGQAARIAAADLVPTPVNSRPGTSTTTPITPTMTLPPDSTSDEIDSEMQEPETRPKKKQKKRRRQSEATDREPESEDPPPTKHKSRRKKEGKGVEKEEPTPSAAPHRVPKFFSSSRDSRPEWQIVEDAIQPKYLLQFDQIRKRSYRRAMEELLEGKWEDVIWATCNGSNHAPEKTTHILAAISFVLGKPSEEFPTFTETNTTWIAIRVPREDARKLSRRPVFNNKARMMVFFRLPDFGEEPIYRTVDRSGPAVITPHTRGEILNAYIMAGKNWVTDPVPLDRDGRLWRVTVTQDQANDSLDVELTEGALRKQYPVCNVCHSTDHRTISCPWRAYRSFLDPPVPPAPQWRQRLAPELFVPPEAGPSNPPP